LKVGFTRILFHSGFPGRGLPQKAVVPPDDDACHPNDSILIYDESCITVCFHSVSAVIQPMDQGTVASMKLHYQDGLRTVADEGEKVNIFHVHAMKACRESKV
jgi:predicted DCC family thiol-disulfide oxidoreductase YuxK